MKIFVTGGSSGIGRCLLEYLGSQHDVTAPTRKELDLAHYPCVDLQHYDCVILCAGSDLGGKNKFVDMQDQHWQNTMQVNLLSNMKLIKDYVQARQHKPGKIIVFGSTATDHVWPTMLPYSISKLALESFCQALRQELPPNLGICVIRPGLVKTNFNMSRHQGAVTQQQSDQWYASQPHLLPHQLMPTIGNILLDTEHHIKDITISP